MNSSPPGATVSVFLPLCRGNSGLMLAYLWLDEGYNQNTDINSRVDGNTLEEVNTFQYLGCTSNEDV